MNLSTSINEKAALIWAIADKLTGVYKPHEYGEVILPLTVIRRFDCILADTKEAVLEKYDEVKTLPMRDVLLRKVSGYEFYNTSKYTFEKLLDDPDNIEENFHDYLNGFSENVRDIIEKFKFDGHIDTMANKGILYIVIKEFTSTRANLHPDIISNLEMGYIFEEIIRRFSESHNEDAGQHYTPREVIRLMVNILFYDDSSTLSGKNIARTIYDPACGTGGMLSVAEEYLHELNSSTELMSFGQELNDQTFAICKADMLIKGNNADFIKDGNTLSDDQFEGQKFDYIISNPPFGREWKNEKRVVEDEAKRGFAGRFGAGLPAASDGQMLFLMTAISKMKEPRDGGSRIAIIHNGSPLFTGDAGSGPSDIRKYILESDLLEAIIALPNDIFYNTGIATYIWVLSNKKAGTRREGKVQLINANGLYEKRRKALGNKRNDIPESAIAEIHVTLNVFNNFSIPIPLKEVQRNIGNYLDDKCSRIDTIIDKQRELIAKLKVYKQSIITETVTKGLKLDVKLKDSGIEFIGEIPFTWKVCRLRNIGVPQNGISKGGEFFGYGYPFVSYGDVYQNYTLPIHVDGLIDTTDNERKNYSVEEGDIFFTRTSETVEGVGFSSVCEKTIPNAAFAGFIIRVRPFDDTLYTGYSKYYFRSSHHRAYLVKEMNLVTRASLGQDLLKSMPVLLPPMEEQKEIAKFLDKKCSAIDNAIKTKEKIIDKLIAYKKSLIYEVVTGKKEVI